MQGYFVTFFTQQNRSHDGVSPAELIIQEAKKLGIGGATLFSGREGFGHDGQFHSDNYFDFEDTPLQVGIALSPQEYDQLMDRLKSLQVRVFYTKSNIEYGFTTDS